MLTLTPVQEAEIEKFGGLLYTRREICTILRLDYNDALACPAFCDIVDRARLIRLARVRESIIQHAEAGSSPAQTLAIKLLDTLRVDEAGE